MPSCCNELYGTLILWIQSCFILQAIPAGVTEWNVTCCPVLIDHRHTTKAGFKEMAAGIKGGYQHLSSSFHGNNIPLQMNAPFSLRMLFLPTSCHQCLMMSMNHTVILYHAVPGYHCIVKHRYSHWGSKWFLPCALVLKLSRGMLPHITQSNYLYSW